MKSKVLVTVTTKCSSQLIFTTIYQEEFLMVLIKVKNFILMHILKDKTDSIEQTDIAGIIEINE